MLFPEMSLSGSVDPATHPERLITLSDPAVVTLTAASAGTGVAICFGIAERDPAGVPRITQLFAAGGEITAVQRKRHLGDGEEAFTAAAGPPSPSTPAPGWASPSVLSPATTARSTTPRPRARR